MHGWRPLRGSRWSGRARAAVAVPVGIVERPPSVSRAGVWLRVAWCRWLPLVLLAAGAEMRVRQFAGNRSLWLDESLIARDIAGTSFAGLTRPLGNSQGAPLLWLWAERGVTRVLGEGEQAFRLVPLLAGLLVLVLSWLLARELLPAAAVPVALAVVVLNPALLDYSTEAKQYESDVAVFLALALIATRLLRAPPGASRRRWLAAWALAGSLAVWCSHPAVFACAGAAAVTAAVLIRARAWRTLAAYGAATLAWATSFALEYVLMLRSLGDRTMLVHYWTRQGGLPSPGDSFAGRLRWLAGRWTALSANPLALHLGALAGVLIVAGAVLLWRRGPAAALVVAPVPLMVLAGLAGAYPLDGRLALDLVPIAALSLAALVAPALRPPAAWPDPRRRALAGAAAAGIVALLAGAALHVLPQVAAVRLREEMRPVMARLHGELRPGDRVLVAGATYSSAEYYAGRERVGISGVFTLRPTPPGLRCDDRAVVARAGLAGRGARMWIVLGHRSASPFDAPWTVMLAHFQRAGHVAARIRAPGAAAYLITPRVASDPEVAPPPAGDRRCLRIVAPRGAPSAPIRSRGAA